MKFKTKFRCLHFFHPERSENIFEFHKCIFLFVCSFPSRQVTKQVILARLCFSKLFIELTPSCNCYRRAISQVTSLRIPFSFISSIRYYVIFEWSDFQRLMTTILVEMKSIIILCQGVPKNLHEIYLKITKVEDLQDNQFHEGFILYFFVKS